MFCNVLFCFVSCFLKKNCFLHSCSHFVCWFLLKKNNVDFGVGEAGVVFDGSLDAMYDGTVSVVFDGVAGVVFDGALGIYVHLGFMIFLLVLYLEVLLTSLLGFFL